jgi:hypothetical protein
MLQELGKLISAVTEWLVTDGLPKLVKLWAQWNAALLGWMIQIAPELAKGLFKMAVELSQILPKVIAKLVPVFAEFGVAMGKAAANSIIDQINAAFDRIANMAKGPLGGILPDINVPDIPYLAKGGIVTRPTLAMIGEGRGPEAVIPLNRMGEFGMGGGMNITVQTGVGDPVAIGKAVSDVLNAYNRRTGNAAA